MIIKSICDDIFKTEAKHIAFAINSEGFNDMGFAGVVADNYWPELMICGEHKIGTVLSKTVGNKTFHALVCHSLNKGWGDNQAEVIRDCFDNIPVNDEAIATIAIGTGFVGLISGADFREIVYGMHASSKDIMLYSSFNLDDIISYVDKKGKIKKRIR